MKGFTLIEVLAAIVIFGVMAAGVATTLDQMSKLTKRVKNREATILGAQIAIDRLQRDLQMAFNENIAKSPSFFKARDVTHGPEISFTYLDSPTKVLFETRTPGFKALRYHVERSDEGSLQLLRTEVTTDKIDELDRSPSRLIVDGLGKLSFQFYHFQSDRWLNSWDTAGPESGGKFPRAIRISLEVIDFTAKETSPKRKLLLETSFQILNEMDTKT